MRQRPEGLGQLLHHDAKVGRLSISCLRVSGEIQRPWLGCKLLRLTQQGYLLQLADILLLLLVLGQRLLSSLLRRSLLGRNLLASLGGLLLRRGRRGPLPSGRNRLAGSAPCLCETPTDELEAVGARDGEGGLLSRDT